MLSEDIELFDEAFGDSDTAIRFRDAWRRIKTELLEAQKTSDNTARDKICPQCRKYALVIGSQFKLCTKCGYLSSNGQTSPVA